METDFCSSTEDNLWVLVQRTIPPKDLAGFPTHDTCPFVRRSRIEIYEASKDRMR